jgi:hypothetical protein
VAVRVEDLLTARRPTGRLTGLKPRKLPKLHLKKRQTPAAYPGPRVRQVSIGDDDAPAPLQPSPFLAASAPMPIPGRSDADNSMDSEDGGDEWGHFSFEDGAPPSSLEHHMWN